MTFLRLFFFHRRCGKTVRRSISCAAATVWRDVQLTLRSPL
jgi:hypothetical protein